MVAGGFIAGLAFVCSGVLEYELEQTYPMLPSKGEAFVNFVNSLPCNLTMVDSRGNYQFLSMGDMTTIKKIPVQNISDYRVIISAPKVCGHLPLLVTQTDMNIPIQEHEVRPCRKQIMQKSFYLSRNYSNSYFGGEKYFYSTKIK